MNGPRPRRPQFCNSGIPTVRHPRTLSPHSPRRGECWAARGGPCLGQCAPVPKTGHALADPFFATGRCGPAGTREPSPRAPHGVGSSPRGVLFGSVCPSSQTGSRTRRLVFCNWEMRTGRHQRTLPPRSPRRGECWTVRGGEVWASLAELPKRVTRSSTRFLQLGDAGR